jgi:site-specific recombinase
MNKAMFFAGVLTFFLFFYPVTSVDRNCCGHTFKQDMAVMDFIIPFPSCSTIDILDIFKPTITITAFLLSIYWMVGSMAGWGDNTMAKGRRKSAIRHKKNCRCTKCRKRRKKEKEFYENPIE